MLDTAAVTPGDIFLSVVPSGNGDPRKWRVTAQHGPTVHTGNVVVDSPKSRAEYIRSLAIRLSVDADDLFWWLDPDIRAHADHYLSTGSAGAPEPGEAPPPAFTRLMDCAALLALDIRPRYLVRGVLVEGQPCVVGGRSKVLKTSVATDLIVSLGTGTPFLGEFPADQCQVAFWSGESGAATIRETAKRVAAARAADLASASILWSFDLPKLARDDHLFAFRETIDRHRIKVAVVDPLYLALIGPETARGAGNVFTMGAVLQPLSEIGQETGCTIVLLHHFRKGGAPDQDEPAALEELSQSGVAEWARQWVLLARRSAYQADGHHELWLRCGGSAGHASLWALDVHEGLIDPESLDGRRRDVSIRSVSDVRNEATRAAEDRKARQRAERDEDDRRRMLEALRRTPDGDTVTGLRQLAGLSGARAADALRTLVGEGRAEACDVQKYQRIEKGYRPTGKASRHPGFIPDQSGIVRDA